MGYFAQNSNLAVNFGKSRRVRPDAVAADELDRNLDRG